MWCAINVGALKVSKMGNAAMINVINAKTVVFNIPEKYQGDVVNQSVIRQ